MWPKTIGFVIILVDFLQTNVIFAFLRFYGHLKPPGISTWLYFNDFLSFLVLVIINITNFSNTVQYSAFIYENHFNNLITLFAAAASAVFSAVSLFTTINSLIFDHLKGGGILCCAYL